jgi:tetratricopeptide (TPR) repeat protein
MGKKNDENMEKNVVYFPKLKERLIDKGMHALQMKDYHEAISFFEQLVEVEPEHPQGNIGMVLCLIELKSLEEAKERCETLLKQDIGDYFDTVQIYISILIQLGEYTKSKDIIEALFQEEKVPAHLREHFEQILQFSEKMVLNVAKEENRVNSYELEEIISKLESGNREEQLVAIQEIDRIDDRSVLPYIEKYLVNPTADPINKTILLTIVKEKGLISNLTIHKFGKQFELDVDDLKDPFNQTFNIRVLNLVSDLLEQENPTLYELIKQLWWNYILSIYPNLPDPLDEQLWSNALLLSGYELSGIEEDLVTSKIESNHDISSIKTSAEKILNNERFLSSNNQY